jgi:hypothetical protein
MQKTYIDIKEIQNILRHANRVYIDGILSKSKIEKIHITITEDIKRKIISYEFDADNFEAYLTTDSQ